VHEGQEERKLQGVEGEVGEARRHHALVRLQDPAEIPGDEEQAHRLDRQQEAAHAAQRPQRRAGEADGNRQRGEERLQGHDQAGQIGLPVPGELALAHRGQAGIDQDRAEAQCRLDPVDLSHRPGAEDAPHVDADADGGEEAEQVGDGEAQDIGGDALPVRRDNAPGARPSRDGAPTDHHRFAHDPPSCNKRLLRFRHSNRCGQCGPSRRRRELQTGDYAVGAP
jgi:hypothetical protein